MKKRSIPALLILLLLVLTSCSENRAEAGFLDFFFGGSGSSEEETAFVPTFYPNSFDHPEDLGHGIRVDTSTAADGYMGISAVSEKPLKLQLIQGEITCNFDIPSDGTVSYIPFAYGSGVYRYRILRNTVGSKYIELVSGEKDVELTDEFSPFLHANVITSFTEESECVAKAIELCEGAETDAEYIKRVYTFMKDSVTYDYAFAESVAGGYVPDPDTVLRQKTGICYDFASLAAALLRSRGIPTRIVTGYVGPDALYHAWNLIWLENSGWISVEIRLSQEDWNRIDLTFAATGAPTGAAYVDRFIY